MATTGTSSYHQRKELRSRIGKMRRELERTEERIAAYTQEKEEINRYFLDNPLDYATAKQSRMEELERLLAEDEERWITLQEELEEIEEE